ncbi:MAG: ATP-binding SpoIIE family protein phosphatase [Oceanobacter sp.]
MQSLLVLVADDNMVDRKLLARIVTMLGHRVVEASNGAEACAVYADQHPDLVLLDVMMPVMDGKEAAREIKATAGDDFVPVIFLTSLSDDKSLAECLESGGDDFLSKPYNPVILRAKMQSFWRMRDMHTTLQQQMATIAGNNEHLIHEQRAAKSVFDNVAHRGCLGADNIRYLLSPLAVFNGDVLLASRSPNGNLVTFIGDFTGHGLPAAIGAMPLAEIFYGMTAKGFGVRDVIREINLKLGSILPTGFFCCAAMAELSPSQRKVSMWTGGLPEGYLIHSATGELIPVKSRHLPLGVLSNERFDDGLLEYPMDVGDRLLFWSDGILEARNQSGDMFGHERLSAVLGSIGNSSQAFDAIQAALTDFQQGSERDDDITLLDVCMVPEETEKDSGPATETQMNTNPLDWQLTYDLEPSSLKYSDPLPTVMHFLMEVPGLKAMSSRLYTVLAELYSNALEHGVMGLQSSLKSTPEGFAQYYQQREQKLKTLESGYVRIFLRHQGDGHTGELVIRFEDSGAGFDYQSRGFDKNSGCKPASSSNAYSGRGLKLLSEICQSLQYSGNGNTVTAVIRWPQAVDSQ